ncbi:MAG: hypothetical protein K2X81_27925 [Candidatus Obscuribacterales bacterium]|nr:hypothetical protein [Candidatus Obscuribacterales bacterium]
MKVLSSISSVSVIALALMLSACTQTKTFEVGDAKGTVTTDGNGNGTIKVNGSKGETISMNTGTNAAPAPDFPISVYPGSKCQLAMNQSGAGAMQTCALTTTDPLDKVSTYYKGWLESNGWTIKTEAAPGGVVTLIAEKGDQTASLMIVQGSGGQPNNINLTVSAKK